MPTWVKVVLVIVIVAFVLMAAGIFVVGRRIRAELDALVQENVAAQDEGKKFGQGRDAEACTVESLARLERCSGVTCEAQNMLFLTNCLQTATTPPGYCEEIRTRTPLEECQRRGWRESSQRCATVLAALKFHCDK